jgi:hypothetical protein
MEKGHPDMKLFLIKRLFNFADSFAAGGWKVNQTFV